MNLSKTQFLATVALLIPSLGWSASLPWDAAVRALSAAPEVQATLLADKTIRAVYENGDRQGLGVRLKHRVTYDHPAQLNYDFGCRTAEVHTSVVGLMQSWWVCGSTITPVEAEFSAPRNEKDSPYVATEVSDVCKPIPSFSRFGSSARFLRQGRAARSQRQFTRARQALLNGLDWYAAEERRAQEVHKNIGANTRTELLKELALTEQALGRPLWARFWLSQGELRGSAAQLWQTLNRSAPSAVEEDAPQYATYLGHGLVGLLTLQTAPIGVVYEYHGWAFLEDDVCNADSTLGHPLKFARRPYAPAVNFGTVQGTRSLPQAFSSPADAYTGNYRVSDVTSFLAVTRRPLAEFVSRKPQWWREYAELPQTALTVQPDSEGSLTFELEPGAAPPLGILPYVYSGLPRTQPEAVKFFRVER